MRWQEYRISTVTKLNNTYRNQRKSVKDVDICVLTCYSNDVDVVKSVYLVLVVIIITYT